MLDIGWTELLVIAVILIVVVGPKDLPPMIRAFGKMTKRLRQTAGEFRAQFDEALRRRGVEAFEVVGQDFNPKDGSLWWTDNQVDGMGDDLKSASKEVEEEI
mgnify:CR=1 FL=1